MLKIAHRGNVDGPSSKENSPEHIEQALSLGFDAEIDVWLIEKDLWLGHDAPRYQIPKSFIDNNVNNLWIHCKNLKALEYFVKEGSFYNYFWHQEDDFTLTSQNFIWTYPGKEAGEWSVIVDLEGKTPYDCYGICSDYVNRIYET